MNKLKFLTILFGTIFAVSLIGAGVYANYYDDILQGTWVQPNESDIPDTPEGDMIRYGKELIVNTPVYIGPNSNIPASGNRLSCTNCHLDGGTRPDAIPFYVATYEYAPPGKYSSRSGQYTTIEKRINGCLVRSMNGVALPEDSYEIQSMKKYMEWLSTGIADGVAWNEVKGVKTPNLPLLSRAADPVRGKSIYQNQCAACHGDNGQGEWDQSKGTYKYPQLYGNDTFNTGAGMHRMITTARFIQANMPYGDPKSLSVEDAYDVAAYINSQPRPTKANLELDWSGTAPDGTPNIEKKSVDAPYGPYYPADMFPDEQFKYGPWQPIIDARNALN